MKQSNTMTPASADAKNEAIEYAQIFNDWLKRNARPYQELMSFFNCAIMEVETKFKVLSEDLSLRYDRNPIESIHTRLKRPESIVNKLIRKQYPLSINGIEDNIQDIAGVRVVCSFLSDIYMLAKAFLAQDDVTLIAKKDYIANPKENGYRSLHLIVSVPIFLHDEKKLMKVEVQMRTLAMDLWASTEHRIRYKKDVKISDQDNRALLRCAETCALIDSQLEKIYHHTIETDPEYESIF